MVLLTYLSNFWKTLAMPIIKCEIILILTWSGACFIVANLVANQLTTFPVTDLRNNIYIPAVTLSTQYKSIAATNIAF